MNKNEEHIEKYISYYEFINLLEDGCLSQNIIDLFQTEIEFYLGIQFTKNFNIIKEFLAKYELYYNTMKTPSDHISFLIIYNKIDVNIHLQNEKISLTASKKIEFDEDEKHNESYSSYISDKPGIIDESVLLKSINEAIFHLNEIKYL